MTCGVRFVGNISCVNYPKKVSNLYYKEGTFLTYKLKWFQPSLIFMSIVFPRLIPSPNTLVFPPTNLQGYNERHFPKISQNTNFCERSRISFFIIFCHCKNKFTEIFLRKYENKQPASKLYHPSPPSPPLVLGPLLLTNSFRSDQV